ncbi:DUF2130 domain-containing protein [Apibacter sp. B2966]|uniref:DUF2130 domain-containing protein n=1 Tax=Apibacter sp. B2966 TaxID=2656761 RepID=UPI0014093399|nr:DUF2130 domain-containing protein [Apibacter sp. B2966]QII72799.1 DUF2130 domain-containing protein [Apibacter sp. B2966]
MNSQTQIKCPNCGNVIDVNDILKHQLEESIKKEYQEKFLSSQKELQEKNNLLERQKEEFEAKKKKENEIFQERLSKITKEKTLEIENYLKKKIEEENQERIFLYEKELTEKSEKLQELNKMQAEIFKLSREKEELKAVFEAEAQKKLTDELLREREKIRKQENEKNELKFKELLKQLEDQKRLTEEMKRKQEQGSMQLQGEVQELAIEEWLAQNFPLDTINEIKKGVRGADCLQIVNTREIQNCGSIYYESKRTKDFQNSWIEKFKNDIREKKANTGVLITEVMPSDMDRMGMKEGIWICTYNEFKGLSAVLRHSIIQFSTIIKSQENKGDKMEMLYDFLTGNEFRLRIEGIVEGFTQMQDELSKEKRAMMNIWSKREKQIEKVIENTISMYGSIKGIAGNAIQNIQALELNTDETLGFDE